MTAMPLRYLLAALPLAPLAAAAQTTGSATYDPSTPRTVRATQLWPEVQAEFALKNNDYLVLGLRGERSTEDFFLRRFGFNNRRLSLAYEHFWNARWSWGATGYFDSNSNSTSLHPEVGNIIGEYLVPGLLLRHRSRVPGGLTCGQRLGLERITPLGSTLGGAGAGRSGEFWVSLRADLAKEFLVGGCPVRPRLSYEAYTHLRFQKADADPEERTVQFTSLRGEVGVRLSPVFDLTPWVAYQTSYAQSLPRYDSKGNALNTGKYNDVYPTVGLDLRFTLLPAGAKADREQLPTQH